MERHPMALSEKEKRHIKDEEVYRVEVREELVERKSQASGGGCLQKLIRLFVVFPLALVFFPVTIAFYISHRFIKPDAKHKKTLELAIVTVGFFATFLLYGALGSISESKVTVIPVKELSKKTETQVQAGYSPFYTNYVDTGLTPSGKVKITGFDVGDANIQIDYSVASGLPVYFGYSFVANPKNEETAWKITGFEKPRSPGVINPGIRNSTVVYWEKTPETNPFKNVTVIFDASGRVGKIVFSMEDNITAQSNRSLYYIPQ